MIGFRFILYVMITLCIFQCIMMSVKVIGSCICTRIVIVIIYSHKLLQPKLYCSI